VPQLDADVSDAHRVIVIGDLHGMLHKTKDLWQSLQMSLGEDALLRALVVFLGDYVDRGPYTKELVSWLHNLQQQRARRGARTVFLCGNHEFCLLGFLGMLPKPRADPQFEFGETWKNCNTGNIGAGREIDTTRLWGADEAAGVLDGMHLQGRRWAGDYAKSYGSTATFGSYGAPTGDRESLGIAMPSTHLDFLSSCPWVHIEENPLLGRLIFVHAGLESDDSEDCETQLARLKERDARDPHPEALFGREVVMHTPPQLSSCGTTVISGHHGRVVFKRHRIILDSCCGEEKNPLMALVMPEMLLVHNDGTIEQKGHAPVFGSHWQSLQDRAISKEASQRASKSSVSWEMAPEKAERRPSKAVNGTDAAEAAVRRRKSKDSSGSKATNVAGCPKPSPRKKSGPTSPRTRNPTSPRRSPRRSSGKCGPLSPRKSRGTARYGSGDAVSAQSDTMGTFSSTFDDMHHPVCQQQHMPQGDSSPLEETQCDDYL
jgi:hypothetical protein